MSLFLMSTLSIWMGRGDHSKTFLPLALFCWSTPSLLKVGGGGGGVVAHVIIVSAPAQRIGFFGFFRLGLDLGSTLGTYWDGGLGLGLGLDN